MTNDIKVVIEELLFYAGKNLDMYEEDYILRRNNLLDLLKVDAPAEAPVDNCRPLQEILDDVNEYAGKSPCRRMGKNQLRNPRHGASYADAVSGYHHV